MKKLLSLSLAVILLASLTAACKPDEPGETITIKGEKYRTDLTELDLTGKGLTDSDIAPLAKMTDLTELLLGYNQIKDLSPLSGLKKLTMLELNDNQLESLIPLSDLVELRMLCLSGNQITDLTPLSGLNELVLLELDGNPITDWSPVDHIPEDYIIKDIP
jgi:Leucine-rich repeat (LRR) protein